MADGLLGGVKRRWKGLLNDVENLSIGLGQGITSQLEGIKTTVEHPVETVKQVYQGVRGLAENPSVIPGLISGAYKQATSGPLALGEAIGANISLRPKMPRSLLDMTVYHGSPHDFDRFDMSKVGTGEGAQAYGHGLYVAESPEVAGTYRQRAGTQPGFGNFEMSDAARSHLGALEAQADKAGRRVEASIYSELSAGDFPPDVLRKKLDASRKMGEIDDAEYAEGVAALDTATKELQKFQGKLYTVDLPDSAISQMLDWDAPLSQQPEIAAAINAIMPNGRNASDFATGRDLYSYLSRYDEKTGAKLSQQKVSEMLKNAGIPGIKYLDGSSRGAGEGTRNFVVFDDKLLKILKKE